MDLHFHGSIPIHCHIEIKGICLGFRFNIPPLIMQSIVNTTFVENEIINKAPSSFIDDIFINENICLASSIKESLEQFGLICKAPEQLRSSTYVLKLHVWEKCNKLCRHCGGKLLTLPNVITHVWEIDGTFFSVQFGYVLQPHS